MHTKILLFILVFSLFITINQWFNVSLKDRINIFFKNASTYLIIIFWGVITL